MPESTRNDVHDAKAAYHDAKAEAKAAWQAYQKFDSGPNREAYLLAQQKMQSAQSAYLTETKNLHRPGAPR